MSTESRALVVRATDGDEFKISLNPEFDRVSQIALALAEDVKAVKDGMTQTNAITAIASLDNALRFLEQSREAVKKPFLHTGREIDRIAKVAASPLEMQASRVRGLVAGFQRAENDRMRAEAQRIENERREADARVARLEQERLEKERLAAEAKGKKRAQLEAEAAELEQKSTELQIEQSMAPEPTIVAPPVISGASAKRKFRVEVVNITELYAAFPACVKLEPRLSEINNLIEMGIHQIPGVKLTEELAIQTRTSAKVPQNYLR